jgi:asparagine synthase (glutamine-hydrolysing)
MCGIFAYFSKEDIDSNYANKLLKDSYCLLRDRGPDGSGFATINSSNKCSSIYSIGDDFQGPISGLLLHTRLAIQDLSSLALQPMKDDEDNSILVFNGEIYNFLQLRFEIESFGYRFKSKSDTEVLLYGWKIWGCKLVNKLQGMFAIIIYDAQEKKVYLIRDRVGIKPLYYYLKDGELIAGSTVEVVVRALKKIPEVDWNSMEKGKIFDGIIRPNTAFLDINSVEPGTIYIVDLLTHEFTKRKYWNFSERKKKSCSEEDELIDKLDRLLNDSVEKMMVSDRSIAVMMSGGIDSSLIGAIAKMHNTSLVAYTLNVKSNSKDHPEVERAKKFAASKNIAHKVIDAPINIELADLELMFNIFDEPMGFIEPHFYIAKQMAVNNDRVVLCGLGPDELMSGYHYYKNIRQLNVYKKIFWVLSSLRKYNIRIDRVGDLVGATNYDAFYGHLVKKRMFWKTKIYEKSVDLIEDKGDEKLNYKDLSFMDEINNRDLKFYIGSHHNHTTDSFLMNQGIEGRFPYLDENLLDFTLNLDQKYKYSNGTGKYLLKKLARRYLPSSIIDGKKYGFNIYPSGLFNSSELRDYLFRNLNELKLKKIISSDVINKKTKHGDISLNESELLYLVSLNWWVNKYAIS